MCDPITSPDAIQHRVCRKCGVSKPLSEFSIAKSKRNGKMREVRRATCRQCKNAQHNVNRREKSVSREHITPLTKVCPRCGVERSSKEFGVLRRNLDGLQDYCKVCRKAYYDANKEREVGRTLRWQRENMDRHMEKQRRWMSRNTDKVRATKRVIENRRRSRIAGAGGSYTQAEWETLCAFYNYRCLACGAKKPLTADHVVPVSKGGSSDITNIQPLCFRCNNKKRARTIDYRVGGNNHANRR